MNSNSGPTHTRSREMGVGGWLLALVVLALVVVGGFALWQFGLKPDRQPAANPEKDKPAIGGSTADAEKAVAKQKFERIAAAAAKHADRTGAFPNDMYAADGTPLLSWRVAVLPDIGQEALYQEFKLTEPWDSDHNKKLLPKMPEAFAIAGPREDGRTIAQGFFGPAGATPRPLFVAGDRAGLKVVQVADGTSNTALCVEAADAAPWTKPGGLPLAPATSLPKLGGHFGAGVFVAKLDGSVLWLPTEKTPEKTLRAFATANGGESTDLP